MPDPRLGPVASAPSAEQTPAPGPAGFCGGFRGGLGCVLYVGDRLPCVFRLGRIRRVDDRLGLVLGFGDGLLCVLHLNNRLGHFLGLGFGCALRLCDRLPCVLRLGDGLRRILDVDDRLGRLLGLGAGLLPWPRIRGRAEIALLAAYGAVAAYAFGFLMNMWFWPYSIGEGTELSFVPGDPIWSNLHRFALFTLASSTWGWDTGRAITNVVAVDGDPTAAHVVEARDE